MHVVDFATELLHGENIWKAELQCNLCKTHIWNLNNKFESDCVCTMPLIIEKTLHTIRCGFCDFVYIFLVSLCRSRPKSDRTWKVESIENFSVSMHKRGKSKLISVFPLFSICIIGDWPTDCANDNDSVLYNGQIFHIYRILMIVMKHKLDIQ